MVQICGHTHHRINLHQVYEPCVTVPNIEIISIQPPRRSHQLRAFEAKDGTLCRHVRRGCSSRRPGKAAACTRRVYASGD